MRPRRQGGIGLSAFSLCSSILELKLPASAEKIGSCAFYPARRLGRGYSSLIVLGMV